MSSIQATARRAGVLYLLMSILSIFAYLYVPSTFIVSGDAAATARRITENALTYRLSIVASLVGQILFLWVVLTLYQLFRDVNRNHARLMVVLVCVGVAGEVVNIANRMAPLVLLGGADFLSVFSRAQLEALSMGFLRLGGNLGRMLTIFWGLWLFPFGILTIRSRYFPRVLGILLFASGVGYVVTCLAFIAFPAQLSIVSRLMTPLYFGELGMVLWLPIMGAKAPKEALGPSEA